MDHINIYMIQGISSERKHNMYDTETRYVNEVKGHGKNDER